MPSRGPAIAITSALVLGCGDLELKPIELPSATESHPQDFKHYQTFTGPPQLDVLIVVDDSRSMEQEWPKVPPAVEALVERLEATEVDYEIGFTTTDNGHATCSTHGGGRLRGEEWCDGPVAFVPTHEGRIRPWIERTDGVHNFLSVVTPAKVASCLLPDTQEGCGFEAPLETMRMALIRAQAETEPELGFERITASLAVVIITDESDCSLTKEGSMSSDLTNADCWRLRDDPATLRPVEPYSEFLWGFAERKALVSSVTDITVTVVAGFPGAASPSDDLAPLDDFQAEFGVAPGCSSATGLATPPARLRELAAAFAEEDHPNTFSICDDDLAPALTSVVDRSVPPVEPGCIWACVDDLDPDTDALEPDCTVVVERPHFDRPLQQCRDGRPVDEFPCWQPITDAARMDPACSGVNVELEIRDEHGRRPIPAGTHVRCRTSQFPWRDCDGW